MDARGIDGVDADYAGQHGWDHGARKLVDELAEDRVFLRRAADDGERPDRVVAMIYVFDAEDGKVVLQAVVAKVIAERTLGKELAGDHGAADAEVGVGMDGQTII